MTYREEADGLNKIMSEKSKIIDKFHSEEEFDGFKEIDVFTYNKAHDEHTDAANKYGAIISKMSKYGHKWDDEYND